MVLGVQEGTYLKIAENVKIVAAPKRKPHFWCPGPPRNPPQIAARSIPRAFYVKVHFQDAQKTHPVPPRGPLGMDFSHKGTILAPKLGPS